jgi:hypothetical protein
LRNQNTPAAVSAKKAHIDLWKTNCFGREHKQCSRRDESLRIQIRL